MAHSFATRAPARRRRARPVRAAAARRRTRRRALLVLLAAPLAIRILLGAMLVLAIWVGANWGYPVIPKPSELFFPVDRVLAKAPSETWRQYGSLFREHSPSVIPPELLGAL